MKLLGKRSISILSIVSFVISIILSLMVFWWNVCRVGYNKIPNIVNATDKIVVFFVKLYSTYSLGLLPVLSIMFFLISYYLFNILKQEIKSLILTEKGKNMQNFSQIMTGATKTFFSKQFKSALFINIIVFLLVVFIKILLLPEIENIQYTEHIYNNIFIFLNSKFLIKKIIWLNLGLYFGIGTILGIATVTLISVISSGFSSYASLVSAHYAVLGKETNSRFFSFFPGTIVAFIFLGLMNLVFFILNYSFCNLVMTSNLINIITLILQGVFIGAITTAVYNRVSGGIFTKSADVAADIIAKFDVQGLKEDDARNPLSIADNVGDRVGDLSGSAGFFTSLFLGVFPILVKWKGYSVVETAFQSFYYIVCASLCALVFFYFQKYYKKQEESKNYITWSNFAHTSIISFLISFSVFFLYKFFEWFYLKKIVQFLSSNNEKSRYILDNLLGGVTLEEATKAMKFGLDIILYLLIFMVFGVILIMILTYSVGILNHYILSKRGPRVLGNAGAVNPSLLILKGISWGKMHVFIITLMMLVVNFCLFPLLSKIINLTIGLSIPHYQAFFFSFFFIPYLLIADNMASSADVAGGLVELGAQDEGGREITDRMDMEGNTIKAITKTISIILTINYLAYSSNSGAHFLNINLINLAGPIAIVLFFASYTLNAVQRNAEKMINKIKNDIKDNPAMLEENYKPDYNTVINNISANSFCAGRKSVLFTIIIFMIFAFIYGFEFIIFKGSLYFYIGHLVFLSGVALVFACLFGNFMTTAGALWDNTKKIIEIKAGKKSENYKAAVIGDMVGDPFKDTTGTSLPIMFFLIYSVLCIL